jgi:hypothetical protein
VIWTTANQKIFVQTENENIKIEPLPSFFRSLIEAFVHLETAAEKDEFVCGLSFFSKI